MQTYIMCAYKFAEPQPTSVVNTDDFFDGRRHDINTVHKT